MSVHRWLILTLGPPLLIGGAYAISHPAGTKPREALSARIAQAELRAAKARANERDVLAQACAVAASELRLKLPDDYSVVVRSPFVLAGDQNESGLARLYDEAIQPVTSALWRAYYDRPPDQPLIVVALSNETSYRAAAWSLDGYEPLAYAGYTQRGERRIVLNTATGSGTLTHELSHLLALFDFPEMPEWFDEGLAALHEEAELSPDGLLLVGQPNWRGRLLRESLAAGTLPSLETVIRTHSFRGEGENLNYAQVRGLCLFLQERGLLSHYYRKLRAAANDDPSGLATLCELLGVSSSAEIDRQFREWISRSGVAVGDRPAASPAL